MSGFEQTAKVRPGRLARFRCPARRSGTAPIPRERRAVRRAEAAVSTLQGDELQRLSLLATDADRQLAGGDRVISISLVALLLIVIIVILIAK